MNSTPRRNVALAAAIALSSSLLVGCSGSNSSSGTESTGGSASTGGAAADSPILPVDSNPITNTSTVEALTIDSVLVENNIDASGQATDDHLEIALTNGGATDLTGFEVFYTFTDPKTNETESYYARLPATFTIAPGAQRVAHFDNTGADDHFDVNEFSLYFTDTNALDVTVEVSATDAAVQTASVSKDAGGEETAD